jgi:hypothetical protein
VGGGREKRTAYRILVGKLERKIRLGFYDVITVGLKEMG